MAEKLTPKKYKTSLFIFRRDLRLHDNTALNQAALLSETVIPCFIVDPRQAGDKNTFRSDSAVQFMHESLTELDIELRVKKGHLSFFYGEAEEVITQILKKNSIDALFFNKDYTPFSVKRDTALALTADKHGCAVHSYEDVLLTNPERVKTLSNTPYTVFTPFFKHTVRTYSIATPEKLSSINFTSKKIVGETPNALKKILYKSNTNSHVHGGRKTGLVLLKKIKSFKNYTDTRNLPALETTNLSAHHKFGTISIRETYQTICKELAKNHPLVQQLYWRDFFSHVAYHSPFVFGQPFKAKYKKLKWENNAKKFAAWCSGTTGFPIVDAGMRQLNETGFMHNRVRMITASFLIKNLHIDWQWGEKYFAQNLVDYDPAVNNGNWQWVASTGCDAQPYFRIFNPWIQQKKFDPECVYIKRWIPEIKTIKPAVIHRWFKDSTPLLKQYPRPVVDHTIESKKTKVLYQRSS